MLAWSQRNPGGASRVVFAATLLTTIALAACSINSNKGKKSSQQPIPSGSYTGALLGGGVSGILTIVIPAASPSPAPARPLPFAPLAGSATITGTLDIAGGNIIPLTGTYDPAAKPELTETGGGYVIVGKYTGSDAELSGSFSGPGASGGLWTASSGTTTVRVFCGTYSGTSSGDLDLVLDGLNRLFGVLNGPDGPGRLRGSYTPGNNPNVSLTFPGGIGSGNVDPSAGVGSGVWSEGAAGGTWMVSTTLCHPQLTGAKLFGVWAVDPSNVFAVGEGGTILYYNGTSWSPRSSGTTDTLYAIGPNLIVVGARGTILGYNAATGTWSPQSSGTTNALYQVARARGGGFFAVGAGGTVLYYDGTSWVPQAGVPTTNTLFGVTKVPQFPYDFAVGAGGVILFFDGTSWVSQSSGTTNDLFCVVVATYADPSLGTNVYALGAAGTILHYDGTTWTAQASGTANALRGGTVAGVASGWVVGDAGTILSTPNGSTWSPQESGTTSDLTGVSAALPNDAFAVGDNGRILHYDGAAWVRQH